jgi:sorbitol-6-phosphate 2-dehydrogenase
MRRRTGLHVSYLQSPVNETGDIATAGIAADRSDSDDGIMILEVDDPTTLSVETIRELFFGYTQTHDIPGAVVAPGFGVFGLGVDIDSARENACAAREGREVTMPGSEKSSCGSAAGRGDVLDGAVSAVTGGAQGFGEQIVRLLVEAGSTVFVVDLNEEGAAALCERLNSEAGRTVAIPVAANVTDEESVAHMVDRFVEDAGGIDLFVSNAGVLKAGSVKELDLKSFEFVTSVNYTGYFLCVKHVSPVMSIQHAVNAAYLTDIIQINSKSGLEGSNKNGAYAGGKFGGIGLTQSFALELIEDGIKVNSICPGNFFEGPLWSDPDRGLFVQYLNAGKVPGAKSVKDVQAFYEAKVPMKRGCTGEDVMKAIYYIVDQAYETGQAVPVTGGQIMLK